MSEPFDIFLAAPPGLEPLLADEARERGFAEPVVEPGGVRTRGGSNRTLVAPPASSSVWQQHERLQSQGAADEDARPESHPWLSELPAGPSTLLAEERVLTFLSASIGAGNLTNVARDWRQVLCATSAGAQPSYVSHLSLIHI